MEKKLIITPKQAIQLYEMAYPASFNFDEFESIRSFVERVRYCRQRLKKIGVGSSRIVFAVDNEKALKIAKNNKGVAQNEYELESALNGYNISPKVFRYDRDGKWIEVQIARKAQQGDFQRLLGCDFQTVVNIFCQIDKETNPSRYRYNQNQVFADRETMHKAWENDELYPFLVYISDYQPPVADLCRLANWGVVNDNGQERLVIVDAGLSEEIWNEYYSR